MRGNADPATRRAYELSEPAQRGLGAGTLLLFAAALATGGITSPLLVPAAVLLILTVRYIDNPVAWFAPFVAGCTLAIIETLWGAGFARGLAGGLMLAASTLPGWWWRREHDEAANELVQLDDILAQARRNRNGEDAHAAADLEEIETSLRATAERIDARAVMLWDVEPLRGMARLRASSHGRTNRSVRLHGDPLGWVWEQGMRLRVDPLPLWAEPGTIVVADRLRRQEEHGSIITYAFDPERLPVENAPFDDAAVNLRALLALQQTRAQTAAGERRVRKLIEGLRNIPGELKLNAFAAELCETACAMTDATGAALALWSAEDGIGHVVSVSGSDGGPRPGDVFAPPGSELGLAVRAGQMIVRDADTWSLGRTVIADAEERWIRKPKALATLPLRSGKGVIGVLAVWSTSHPALEPDALDLLNALAPYAALHIEHSLQYDALHDTADRDPLTQLRNRRAFDRLFADEAARMARHPRPLSLLVLDLDHFKSINDTYGHEAGDAVLVRTARLIEAGIRDVDAAARFGGEEFVVMLPETPLNAAYDVAERIRTAVAEAQIEWKGQLIPVRASIGVSCCPERVTLPAELVASADAALYRAKAEGRNRVVVAGR